jgi:hypothetical protein
MGVLVLMILRRAGKVPGVHQRDAVLLHLGVRPLVRVATSGLVLDIVEDLARELDVVVGKLANLGVVDAEDFGLLCDAETKAGDHVHQKEDQASADEGVGAAGERVGQLVGELDPVVVDPAALNDGSVVEMGDVISGKEGGADVADEAADAMNGKDVQGVIDAEEELELGRVVGEGSAQGAEDEGSPERNIAWPKG